MLDAGAFIALERRDPVMVALVGRAVQQDVQFVTSAGVVAQVWRKTSRGSVPISFALRHTTVVDITLSVAKILGRMLGRVRRGDVVDAHVAFLAREREWAVLSSDPDDLLALDSSLTIERV